MITRKIVLVANTAWNLWNFRRALIERLVAGGFEVICMAPADGYEVHLSTIAGLRFVPLKKLSRKGLSIVGNLSALIELAKLLRKEKPSLAVFYTVKPNIFGCLAAARAGVPAVATIEGLGYLASAAAPSSLRRLVFRMYGLALRLARKVVFLNRDDRAEFLRHRVVASEKTLIIRGTGVDTDHFAPVEDGQPPGPVFLFIGRLLSDKGIREFVEAARIVRAAAPEARFRLLGSTDAGNPASIDGDELRRWIDAQSIEYLGQSDDVRTHIAAAGIVVLPSYREGMPRVLLEGMAMGKPVITTDSVGCRDTVEEGRNGLIVPPEDAEALAAAMLRFIRMPAVEREQMGRHSRAKALAEFSNDVILPQYLSLIGAIVQPDASER
ncbi:MAG: glycosyltransferase family 4 protein [Lewinellaceae bacterium]|nr:glycosyltransferase family 4 protein [Lewinellaceae bacterium]